MNNSQYSLKPTTITHSINNSVNNSINTSINNSRNEQISHNELNVSMTQDFTDKTKTVEQLFVCRVCLVEVQASKRKISGLISPCLCTGSVRYVHQECLKYWLNSIISRNLEQERNTYGVFCELCKQAYIYEVKTKWACSPKQQIKSRIKQNKLSLTIAIIFATASIMSIIAIGVLSGLGKMKYSDQDSGYTVFYISFCIFMVLIIVWIVRMLQIYVMKEINFIKSVQERRIGQGTYMQNTLNPLQMGISINI